MPCFRQKELCNVRNAHAKRGKSSTNSQYGRRENKSATGLRKQGGSCGTIEQKRKLYRIFCILHSAHI